MPLYKLQMNSSLGNPTMILRTSTIILCGVVLIQLFASQIDAQRSTSPWQTLSAVVIRKSSVFPRLDGFVTGQTNVVERLKKSHLPVYVELFQNEFVSQPYDFFSDATVEINSYITGTGINGTITEFPFTAARYKRNRCLGRKISPKYMSPVQPGGLLTFVSPQSLPPAQSPELVITDADVIEPPLPPITAKAPTSTPGTPSTKAQAPRGQTRLTLSLLLSISASLLLM